MTRVLIVEDERPLGLGEPASDGQPEPHPGAAAGRPVVAPLERLEHGSPVVDRAAGSAVGDAQFRWTSPCPLAEMRTGCPGELNRRALSTRLATARSSNLESARTSGRGAGISTSIAGSGAKRDVVWGSGRGPPVTEETSAGLSE
jgi:hypothetical protein